MILECFPASISATLKLLKILLGIQDITGEDSMP